MTSQAASSTVTDNRLLGALAICTAVGIASSSDSLVKLLSGGYPIHQINAVRCLVSLLICAGYVSWQGALQELINSKVPFLLARGTMLALGNLTFYLSIATLPLAGAVAIYFTMPFFIAGLVAPFIGERVRAHRWLAIAAGFVGVLIMIRPDRDVFEPAALLALASALFYGIGQAMARPLGHSVKSSVVAFWQAVMYSSVALLLGAIFGSGAFDTEGHASLGFLTRGWSMPPVQDLAIMIGLGIIGGLIMPLFVIAYKVAEASFIAPFEYTSMFWAVLVGYLLFGEVPDGYTFAGAALVISGGLFMLRMDHKFRA